jgi:Tol biopolymer transport system component
VFAGAGETFDLYLSDVDGTGVTQLTDGAGDESFPAWSPDGSRIAFVTDDLGHPPEPFYDSIVVVDPSGGSRIELLTRRDEVFASPAWSPDGRRIAFSAYTQDGYVLYVMNADGTGVTEAHREPRGLFAMPVTWTPDGDRVVFWGSQDGRETLLSVRPDGTGLRVFLEDLPPFADTLELDWSPDERWIVAANVWDLQDPQSGSGPVIFLIRADGSEAFVVGVGGSGPTWRPEGR